MPASLRSRARTRLALFTLLAACASTEPEPSALRSAAQPVASASQGTTAARRGAVMGGEKVARTIAWPADGLLAVGARSRYDATARAAIARSPVPVLAPDDPLERATVTVGAHWYALTVHGDGYSIHVDGSGQARVLPHIRPIEPTHPMRSADGFFTRNEGVWSATWLEHGTAYSFELECDGGKHAWCEDESAVLAKIEALVYLGGKEVRS